MSAVRKLAPEPSYRPMPRPRKKRPAPKVKQYNDYVRFYGRHKIPPFRILFTLALIFAGGIGTAFSYAYLHDMRVQINRERDAILQQRAENTATSAEIAQHLTVEEISRIASERLNMGPADPSQIVRIYVPRQSYVVQSDMSFTLRPDGGMWRSAWWYIRNWLGVI